MVNHAEILGAHILIVDDLEANVRLLEQTLRNAGFLSIASTREPHRVSEMFQENHYDLILLDWEMPDMDGCQVMQALKQIDSDDYLPVLVITAQPQHKLPALQAGAKDFLSKPLDLVEVQVRVRNMIEVRLLHKAAINHAKSLEFLALHDSLTGLANRRLLAEGASRAIAHARRNKSSMALLFLDLDGFKQINDTWGHDAGDELLKLASRRLVDAVREEDIVARLGGDEFIVALWQVGHPDDAATLGAKLITSMSLPYEIQGRELIVTISAGIAIYPVHGDTAETLMKNADVALYDAKRAGKNLFRVSVWTSPVNSHG